MTKNLLLVIMVAFFLLSSCIYTEMHHLDKSDVEWLSVYKDGDVFLFVSDDMCGVDTLMIQGTGKFDTYNPFGNNGLPSAMNANGRIDCLVCHGLQSLDLCIFICKVQKDVLEVYLNFGNRFLNEDLWQNPSLSTMEVCGELYDDVLVVDSSSSFLNDSSYVSCEYFIWSKSKGLIQYKYENGKIYNFYKKLPGKRYIKPLKYTLSGCGM